MVTAATALIEVRTVAEQQSVEQSVRREHRCYRPKAATVSVAACRGGKWATVTSRGNYGQNEHTAHTPRAKLLVLLPIAGLLLVATLGRRVPLRLPRLWVEVVGRAVPAGGSKEESLLISKEGGVAAGAPYGAAEGPRLQSRVG